MPVRTLLLVPNELGPSFVLMYYFGQIIVPQNFLPSVALAVLKGPKYTVSLLRCVARYGHSD